MANDVAANHQSDAPENPLIAQSPNERASLLAEAERLVNGDRNTQYDEPAADFARTAGMWSAYLGVPIAMHDVAAMMALLKVARIRHSPTLRDNWTDLAGYAACGWDVACNV